MARTRRARPDLTESWDDVEDESHSNYSGSAGESTEDERSRRRANLRSNKTGSTPREESPRRRSMKAPREPELIMPSSPNTINGKSRARTPHFRMNERSFTSDAGELDAARTERSKSTRLRLNERSMTSDAGRFQQKPSNLRAARRRAEEAEEGFKGYLTIFWSRILAPILAYCSEIVGLVLNNAKPLIAYVLFAYLLGAGLIFGSGFLTTSINNALTPICRIPGVTWIFNPSFCPTWTAPEVSGPAEFDKLVQAQSAFNDVLAASSTGVNLPLDMKKTEAGIRDLKHVVEYSSLPSKNELVFEFVGFIDTARQASQDLSKFNSRIGHAVDRILSTNRWTLSVIDGIAETDTGRGSISKFFSERLNIFAPFQPVSLSRDILLDQYLKHTSAVEDQILTLISEAQALLNILDNLDGRLDVIAGIATRDGLKAEENRDELFAYLWTKLGGNRSDVKKLNGQIELLQNVGQYRRIAWAHVTNTIVKLQAIRDNLEDLRERVAMPEVVGTNKVPLEVHIEAINLGIQRLEEQRESSRQVEAQAYQRVISRAEMGDGKVIGDREL